MCVEPYVFFKAPMILNISLRYVFVDFKVSTLVRHIARNLCFWDGMSGSCVCFDGQNKVKDISSFGFVHGVVLVQRS